MSEQPVILGYWDSRNVAEKNRMLLEYCNIPYTQKVYDSAKERDQWFKGDKIELMKKNPAANLPYIIDGDKVISESDAICVYICHKGNKK
jgi:glutathione S-transferase